jgi:hypothetical protein
MKNRQNWRSAFIYVCHINLCHRKRLDQLSKALATGQHAVWEFKWAMGELAGVQRMPVITAGA